MSFFYNVFGDEMKIYVDYVLFLNFMFDFLLLVSISLILKRQVKINRLILGAFFGSLTTLLLFFKISNLELFFIKLIISILMIIVSFGFKNVKYFFKNFSILYMFGFILGGVLYAINIQFSYKHEGLVFFHDGIGINMLFLIVISPIVIYLYIKQIKSLKNNYVNYYKIRINFDNHEYKLVGFLDTGNKLTDPYFNRPIILVNPNIIKIDLNEKILIPYSTITDNGLLECVLVREVFIDTVGIKKNVLLGVIKEKIKIDGVDCILQTKLLEE